MCASAKRSRTSPPSGTWPSAASSRQTFATPLQNTLNSRIAIEQAKGVLAERHGISVDEAFTALRRHAREDNLRMPDLARGVADGSPLPPTGGPAPTTSSARRPGSEPGSTDGYSRVGWPR